MDGEILLLDLSCIKINVKYTFVNYSKKIRIIQSIDSVVVIIGDQQIDITNLITESDETKIKLLLHDRI